MELVVEIQSVDIDERTISGQRGEFKVREQEAWLQMPNEPYPQKIKLQLEKDIKPFGRGTYSVSQKSFYINRYGFLEVRKSLILEAAV